MTFLYKRATIKDLDLLTETRIEVLRAANQLSEDADMTEVKSESYRYYKKALCDGTHIAYLVFEGEDVCRGGRSQFLSGYAYLSQSDGQESLHNEYVYKTKIQTTRHCL